MKRERANYFVRIFSVISGIIAAILCICFFTFVKKGNYLYRALPISYPVEVTINNTEYHDVDLKTFSFPKLKHGDHIEYSFYIPDEFIPNPALRIYVNHSSVCIFLDDSLLLQKGSLYDLMMGYGYINATLPEDFAGKKVVVKMDVLENKGLTKIRTPEITDYRAITHNFIAQNCFYLFLDFGIIALCLTLMFIGLLFLGTMPWISRQVFLGLGFFFMGVWEMCSYDIISIFSDSLVLKGYLEYPSLYTGPFFVSLYFYLEFFENESKLLKRSYLSIVIVQGIFPVAATILHFCNIIRYPGMLRASHTLLFISMSFVLAKLIHRVFQHKGTHKYLISGLMLMITVAITDMARYYYYKLHSGNGTTGYTSHLLISFFVFLVALIIDFLINQRINLYKIAQAETMDHLAHNDIMTGLENRLSFEEKMKSLKDYTSTYGIISIDMNNLKITNDKYGHQEGDRLLKDFSLIIKKVCDNLNIYGCRIGGDEFAIIIPDISDCTFEKTVTELNSICNQINQERKPLPISFAYGCCDSKDAILLSSTEKENLVHEVYKLADNRMYECKTNMKKNIKINS